MRCCRLSGRGIRPAAAFVKLAGGAAILGGTVTAAVRGESGASGNVRKPRSEAMEEPKPETMEEARRRVLRMADRDRGVSLLKKALLCKGSPTRRQAETEGS